MNDEQARPQRLTRAETKARTRQLLLAAAARTFARKGFAGASVDEIAESAGFTVGALYSNFASKEELFVELLSGRTGFRTAEAGAIVSDLDRKPDETRTELSRLLREVAEEDADLAPLQAEFWLYAIRRPEFLELLAGQFRRNRDAMAATLADRARDRGQSGEVPFEGVATVVMALFQGLVQLRRTDPGLVPESLYGDALHWLFVGINRTFEEQGAGEQS